MSEADLNILKVANLKKHFIVKRGLFSKNAIRVYAVDGISFNVTRGKTLGLVGESGCGKTTAIKSILKLVEPTFGNILFDNIDITKYSRSQMKPIRKDFQVIFQDPYSSLNPRMTVGEILAAPLEIHTNEIKKVRGEIVSEILIKVGLSTDAMKRYPHEFSGGQRQRIGIARALITLPKLIIGDEPVSALDVSIQAQILNLLVELQTQFNLTYIIVSHDLSVISHISDYVAIMYLGKIVESAPRKELFFNPIHPYSQALISALPIPRPNAKRNRIILRGDVPSPINPPKGCRFHTRCSYCLDICKNREPEFLEKKSGHFASCHLF
jgi:oligopeptide transport system ATP-binding protein